MLTAEEKVKLWEMVAKHAAPEKLLIAGTGVESVRETVCLTNRAAELGYKAALVKTPHYYKNLLNRADAQALYYRAVADQARIPRDHLQLPAGHRRSIFRPPPWWSFRITRISSASRKAPATWKRSCR